jgi:uncharacterized coiled-coil protein SlyX
LIKKANDRARFAVEFKKRSTDAEKKVEEKDKLIAEKEKQLAEERTKIAELKKKLEEEGKGTKLTETAPTTQTSESNNKEVSNGGDSKVNQDALRKAEEARAEAVSKLEASEKETSMLKVK